MDDRVLINPVRENNEPYLPEAGLIYINPPDTHRITQLLKTKQAFSHFLFNSKLFTVSKNHDDAYFIAGPSVGAPMAVMTLEKLIALGAKKVIMYGWCGSLSAKLHVGTILVPTWGIPGEGTSAYYPGVDKPAATESLRNFISNYLQKKGADYQTGPVWTTDAIYRETTTTLNKMVKRSVVGVDMEFTAMAKVAAFRGIEFAAVLLVSDALWGEKWLAGYKEPQFKKINKWITTELLEIIQSLGSV